MPLRLRHIQFVPLMFLRKPPPSATFDCAARGSMVQRVSTVAFEGIEARGVDVQVQVAPGLPAFAKVFTNNPEMVGLCSLTWNRPPFETPSLFLPPDVHRTSA